MTYQKLDGYKGDLYGTTLISNESIPYYGGIEFDYEVPNNKVITSPGGVSSTQHHWTKGFYGRGGSSGDIYAGQGIQYISGVQGNLYQQGNDSIHELDYLTTPIDVDFIPEENKGEKNPTRDNFEFVIPIKKDKKLLENPKSQDSFVKVTVDPIMLFVVIIVFYLALGLWTEAGLGLFQDKVNKGKKISWKQYTIISAILTVVFILIMYFWKIPLITIEAI